MGSWPPISPLLSPYGNGFGDVQGMFVLNSSRQLVKRRNKEWNGMYLNTKSSNYVTTPTNKYVHEDVFTNMIWH